MPELRPATLQEHFAELTDPRADRGKLHLLLDILVIALCVVICGADTWVEMGKPTGEQKKSGSSGFCPYPTGFPRTTPLRGCWRG